jgi:hypothetical protein
VSAIPARPPSASRTTWTEKVENVVKPPRTPTPSASRVSFENQEPATSRPSKNEPATLIATVDQIRASVPAVRRPMP